MIPATNRQLKKGGKEKRKIIITCEIRDIFVIVFSNFLANWRTWGQMLVGKIFLLFNLTLVPLKLMKADLNT